MIFDYSGFAVRAGRTKHLIASTGISDIPYPSPPDSGARGVGISAFSAAKAEHVDEMERTSLSCGWTAEEFPPPFALPHVTTLPSSFTRCGVDFETRVNDADFHDWSWWSVSELLD